MSRPESTLRDYYDILGADETTSPREIERLYKRKAAVHHPDKGGSDEAMKSLNEAYRVLKDKTSRREYDEKRQSRRTQPFTPTSAAPARDVGLFGHFLSAFLCLLVGLFLLFLVRSQWIWFLWPLAILSLFVILFGVFMTRSAIRAYGASLPARNPLRRFTALQEAIFWTLVLTSGYGVYILLAAVE
jgi:DnaJ domain